MSTNRKLKPKRKRGQPVTSLSGYTPYSVDKCIERIKAGPSPVRRLNLDFDFDGTMLVVYLHGDGAAWAEPVWFEATFTEDEHLTHVQGVIKREGPIPYMLVALGLPLLLVMSVIAYEEHPEAWLFPPAIVAFIVLVALVKWRYQRQLGRILRQWLSNRLDI